MKRLLLIIFTISCTVVYSIPVPKALLILENGSGKEVIATQQTGQSGKCGFRYLDPGYYQLLIKFPQQEGKFIEGKYKQTNLTTITFDGKKLIYYYQGAEGYFAVQLSGLKRIEKKSLQALYRVRYKEGSPQVFMAQFNASDPGATITITVEAITAAEFKKNVDKLGSDISTISIQGVQ